MTYDAIDLDELERLENAATPGPWYLDEEIGKIGSAHVAHTQRVSALGDFYANNLLDADARFIAAMRTALPALLARARRCEEMETGVLVPTDVLGHPIAEISDVLNFLEAHTGTRMIRPALKRIGDVLRGQKNLIAEQSLRCGKLEAENADLKREWGGLQAIREGLHRRLEEERARVAELESRYAEQCELTTEMRVNVDVYRERVAELEAQLAAVGKLEVWLALDSRRSITLLLDIPAGHDRWELSAVAEGDGPARTAWDKTILGAIEAAVRRGVE